MYEPLTAETTQYLLGHFRQKVIFRTGAKPETAVEFRIHWGKNPAPKDYWKSRSTEI